MTSLAVLITTRNRRDDVVRAVESCLAQSICPAEILVFDDASSDGTSEALSHIPEVQLIRLEQRAERLVLRNLGFAALASDIVVALDDDCYICEPTLFERTAAMMDSDPSIAIVCLPMIEPSRPRNYMPREPAQGEQLGSFLAGACAFRLSAVNGVGGYREILICHGEERDLGARLLDAGWRFIYLGGAPIVHTVSPVREAEQSDIQSLRNVLLVSFLNYPLLVLPARWLVSSINSLRYRWTLPKTWPRIKGIVSGIVASWKYRGLRRPVSWKTYKALRQLPTHGAIQLRNQNIVPLTRKNLTSD